MSNPKVTNWYFRRIKPDERPAVDVEEGAPQWIVVVEGKVGSDYPGIPVGEKRGYTSKRLLTINPAMMTVVTESRVLQLDGPPDPAHIDTLDLPGAEISRQLRQTLSEVESGQGLPPTSGFDIDVASRLETPAAPADDPEAAIGGPLPDDDADRTPPHGMPKFEPVDPNA